MWRLARAKVCSCVFGESARCLSPPPFLFLPAFAFDLDALLCCLRIIARCEFFYLSCFSLEILSGTSVFVRIYGVQCTDEYL